MKPNHSNYMKREFTLEEKKQIFIYWQNNPKMTADDVASHFEKEFKMPVSLAGVVGVLVAKQIGQL